MSIMKGKINMDLINDILGEGLVTKAVYDNFKTKFEVDVMGDIHAYMTSAMYINVAQKDLDVYEELGEERNDDQEQAYKSLRMEHYKMSKNQEYIEVRLPTSLENLKTFISLGDTHYGEEAEE